jgi:general transcription factor IIIA
MVACTRVLGWFCLAPCTILGNTLRLLLPMSLATSSIGSRIVEVVIHSNISKAISLGKRKGSASPAPSCSSTASSQATEEADDSDYDDSEEDEAHVDVWGSETELRGVHPSGSHTPSERPYRCTYQNCMKSYMKPSRLAEHQRSHTGEVCLFLIMFQ